MSISFSLVSGSAVASGVFVEQEYKRTGVPGPIPQKVALLGQYNSGFTPDNNVPQNITSAAQAASLAGYGSMTHRMFKRFFENLGAGSVTVDWFPLAAGSGSSVGLIEITGPASGNGTLSIYIAGDAVKIPVSSGDTADTIAAALAAAINADLSLPVTATSDYGDVDLVAKNDGLIGDDITILQDYAAGDADVEPAGVSVSITDMSGGSTNPSIETALSNLAGEFYTWVICPYNDDTSLDYLEAAGDLRIGPTVKKPFAGVVAYTGTRSNYLTWLNSRNSPWTSSIPVESSPDMPCEIAAATVGKCSLSASAEPARPFKTLSLTNIRPGGALPWTYAEQDAVEKAGGSVTFERSGVVYIGDLLTTYTENALGADDDSFRYTVTITNIQAKIYSLDQLFLSAPFDRSVVVDDDAVTSKEFAVSPKRVKGYLIDLIDNQWIPEAWSKNRDSIVAGIVAEINESNPGRIDVLVPDIIAVGGRIFAIKYQWSFQAAG